MRAILGGLTVVAVGLAGCAYAPVISPADLEEANRPLTCSGKAQCDIYWQRAQAWVSEHSAYKIQTISDAIIQTYGALDSTRMAYIVRRVPSEGGVTRIWMEAGCAGLSCSRDANIAIANFKRFVRDAQQREGAFGVAGSPAAGSPPMPQAISSPQVTQLRQLTVATKPSPGPSSNAVEQLALRDMCTPVGYAVLTGTGQAGDTYRVNCMGGMVKEYACAGQSCSPAR